MVRAKPAGVIAAERIRAAPVRKRVLVDGPPLTQRVPLRGTYRAAITEPSSARCVKGKPAHYMLRWVNSRGETGPWGETATATIGA